MNKHLEKIKKEFSGPKSGVTIGCDPEFFIKDKDTGKFIESAQVLPDPRKVPSNFKVVSDGYQGELHTDPVVCRESFVYQVADSIAKAVEILYTTCGNHTISLDPVINLTKADMKKLKPMSLQFGCAPSFSGYDEEPPDVDARTHLKRYAGGHLHFGVENVDNFDPALASRLSDVFIGLPSVIMARNTPKEAERRIYYGRAGEYRFNEEALVFEYRTPSCFWLGHQAFPSALTLYGKIVMSLIHDGLAEGLDNIVDYDAVRKAINEADINLAIELYEKYVISLGLHKKVRNFIYPKELMRYVYPSLMVSMKTWSIVPSGYDKKLKRITFATGNIPNGVVMAILRSAYDLKSIKSIAEQFKGYKW